MPRTVASVGAWALALGAVAWALFRGLGLESGYPLVALVAFTPYVLVGAVAATGVCLLLRRRVAAVVAATAALALGVMVAPRLVGGGTGEGVPLRVMTANMFVGEADAAHLVELVRRQRIDVLSVQELTPGLVRRLSEAGIARELRERILRPGPGSEGGGLYSRFPLTRLRSTPDSLAGPLPGAQLEVPGVGAAVRVFDFHPPPPINGRATSEWSGDLGSVPAPDGGSLAIVAGDFNATLDHARLREVLDHGYRDAADEAGVGLQPTWPTGRVFPPQVAIDHVLIDARAGVGAAEVLDLEGSDHRAVMAEALLPERGR